MRCLSGLLGLAVVACSSGDTDGMGRKPVGGGVGSGTGSGTGGGSGVVAGSGDFGNPTGGPPVDVGGMGGPVAGSGECEVGMFCGPSAPDSDDCGSLTLETDVEITRTPGNLLVIFDQSGSMEEPWTNGMSKLQAASNALVQALTPLQDSLTVGAIFFPTNICLLAAPPGGAVLPIDQQIPFQPGPQFLQAWQNHFATLGGGLGVGTPMQEAFDQAEVALMNAQLTGQTIVVAFTDGQPNCFPFDPLTGMQVMGTPPTDIEPNRAASWLASRMIKTYMVGLPGGAGVQILNDVAVAGGTMQYIVPDDPTQLEMKLREAVQETVKQGFNSCSITLTPAAIPPEKLLMIVEETSGMRQNVPHEAGPNAGWTISDDGTQVEITGGLCDDAMGGRFSSITFEYGCPDQPPPPTLPPVL